MPVSAQNLSQLLSNSPDFPGRISPATAAEMLHRGVIRRFARGGLVTHRSTGQPRLCIVLSGTVRLTAFFPDGREMLLVIIGPGDCWGVHPCLGNFHETNDGMAETEAEILLLEANVVRDLMWENRELQEALIAVLCTRLNLAVQAATLYGVFNARQRVAWRLLLMSRWTPQNHQNFQANLTLSQETLGAISQLSRQRINTILKGYEAEGIISLHYGGLIILKPEKLHEIMGDII
ncbi:MAG: Crp/Fnr family transcriptional regulator [Paracoccus sp. (in: a-proteobacteria)]